jgi:hypothetical protein
MTEWEDVRQSGIAPIFIASAWSSAAPRPVAVPKELQQMINEFDNNDPDWPYREVLQESLRGLGKLYGGMLMNGIYPLHSLEILAWQFIIPTKSMELARRRRPRTLVILVHFVVSLDILQDLWWLKGVARQEVQTISTILMSEWQSLLGVPQMAVHLYDKNKLAELLLTQLPAMDPMNPLSLKPFFPCPYPTLSEDS